MMDTKKSKSIRKTITVLIIIVVAAGLLGMNRYINNKNKLLKMIDAGDTVVIELAEPKYEIEVQGEVEQAAEWVQLDSLRTNGIFRQYFDNIFNINKISYNKINSKSGCLYVIEDNMHSGNTTLYDAFRNKTFVEKYWNDEDIISKIIDIVQLAYTDMERTTVDSLYASINAYYDLLTDNINPNSFNPSQSVTREQFYALVFKSVERVQELESSPTYLNDTGGVTEHSLYAQQVEEYAFLNTGDNCLDEGNVSGSISRLEAIYMIVNRFFPEQLKTVDINGECYSDCKNAGDLALKAKFKTEVDGVITPKDNWQAYILAYMMQNPNKGIQEELYKPMVVAKQIGLLGDIETESRWDEPLSKAEAIELITDAFLILNKTEGYLTTAEYGEIEESQKIGHIELGDYVYMSKEFIDKIEEIESEMEVMELSDPNRVLYNGVTLYDVAEAVIAYRDTIIKYTGESPTLEELEEQANMSGTTYRAILEYEAMHRFTEPDVEPKEEVPEVVEPTQQPTQPPEVVETPAPSTQLTLEQIINWEYGVDPFIPTEDYDPNYNYKYTSDEWKLVDEETRTWIHPTGLISHDRDGDGLDDATCMGMPGLEWSTTSTDEPAPFK